jgi:selenocysteine-specific elongation factor
VLTRGDRFILRAYSPPTTIAGGSVLDPLPPRTGIRTAAGRARFARLHGTEDEALRALIEESGSEGLATTAIGTRGGVAADAIEATAQRLIDSGHAVRAGSVLVAPARLAALEKQLLAALADHHRKNPLVEGMPREEARERFFARAPQAVFDHVVNGLVSSKRIVARDRLALATHTLALSDEEARARDAIERIYRTAGLKPPDKPTVAAQVGVTNDVAERVTLLLGQLKEDVRALRHGPQPATIDVSAFKERFGVTRKFAIPLLEYLDRERVTRRVGESRQIL